MVTLRCTCQGREWTRDKDTGRRKLLPCKETVVGRDVFVASRRAVARGWRLDPAVCGKCR